MSFLLLTVLLLPAAASQSSQAACSMSADDRQWVDGLLDTWRAVAKTALRIDPDPLPQLIVFDQSCAWRVGDGVDGAGHGGTIQLPDGRTTPATLATLTGASAPADRAYVVMPLPAIWRADPQHQTEPNLPLLMRTAFVHEMVRSVRSRAIGASLAEIGRRLALPEVVDDDIIQRRFEADSEFRASWAAERSLLYQAANEPADSVRRALLVTAVAMIEARRARYFAGDRAIFSELEDLFLTTEGLGQWVGYQVALSEGLSPVEARQFIRRDRTQWSREEGFAAFLLVDALLLNWRDRVLQERPAPMLALLADAARR